MYDFLSHGNSNGCSISHRLRDIRKTRKCQNFDLEHEGQGQGVEQRDSTGNVRIHILDFFFRILAIRDHTFTQKVTHTDTRTHTYSEKQSDD